MSRSVMRDIKRLQRDIDKLKAAAGPAKTNHKAAGVPLVTDDISKGYGIGSTWVFGGVAYFCKDATAGAAVWAIMA